MKSFRLLPASEGPRREFKITLGLRAGYGPSGRIYDLEEAVRTAHRWMTERAARGDPFLSGLAEEMGRMLEQEEVHIAYSDRTWTLMAEPPGP
jgi:hypothetical protein